MLLTLFCSVFLFFFLICLINSLSWFLLVDSTGILWGLSPCLIPHWVVWGCLCYVYSLKGKQFRLVIFKLSRLYLTLVWLLNVINYSISGPLFFFDSILGWLQTWLKTIFQWWCLPGPIASLAQTEFLLPLFQINCSYPIAAFQVAEELRP